MFKKCLHIMVVVLFALSAMAANVQAKPICDMQMSMSSDVPCNMPCHDKDNKSDDKCCGDSIRCNSNVSMVSPVAIESLVYASTVKYFSQNNDSMGLFNPEALKSPPKHLS